MQLIDVIREKRKNWYWSTGIIDRMIWDINVVKNGGFGNRELDYKKL